MATLYDSVDRSGFSRTSNVDLNDVSLPRTIRENGTRKTPAIERTAETTLILNGNGDHLVEVASSLSSYSRIVDQAAEHARVQLQRTRQEYGRGSITSFQLDGYYRDFSDSVVRSITDTRQSAVKVHTAAAEDVAGVVVRNSFPPKKEVSTPHFNPARPDMESVAVQFDKAAGSVDSFFTSITFQVPATYVDNSKLRLVRIFRNIIPLRSFRPPPNVSIFGVDKIIAATARSRSKNLDTRSQFGRRLTENNVKTSLSPIDPFTNGRVSVSAKGREMSNPDVVERPQADGRIEQELRPYVMPQSLMHLDLSVVRDLKTLRNIRVQNPSLSPTQVFDPRSFRVGSDAQMNLGNLGMQHFAENRISDTGQSDKPSAAGAFREIMNFSLDKLSPQKIGQYYRFTIDDNTIRFGSSYQYFITTVDEHMLESTRSNIVQVDIDGVRVPHPPKSIAAQAFHNYVTMNVTTDDIFIEKYEVYRKEVGGRMPIEPKEIDVISTVDGFIKRRESRLPIPNGYVQLSDCLNADTAGSTFVDREVISGRKYSYRVYAVDIFGNKSESPKEFEVYVPELQRKPVELVKPDLLVEVDSKTGKMKITLKNNDSYVRSLFLSRRDLTLGERAFGTPFSARRLAFGNGDKAQGGRRFEGEVLNDKTLVDGWLGRFDLTDNLGNVSTNSIVFVDKTVAQDHTYQYKLYGMDRLGNQTQIVISNSVFVSSRAMVDMPTNLQAKMIVDGSNSIKGIYVSWQDGNIDASSEQMVGDQSVRAGNYLKTLFQVQRKRAGDDDWKNFPLVDARDFFDPVDVPGLPTSEYRPGYLALNDVYYYRVYAYQSGNFLSNATFPVGVRVFVPPLPIVNAQVTSTPQYARPIGLTLSWDDDPRSGPVDRWEIERIGVNRYAAQQFDSTNQLQIASLPFKRWKSVYLESSRFRERGSDETNSATVESAQLGRRYITDFDATNGNVYFYRIRSVSPWDDRSDWTYLTMRVEDDISSRIVDILLSQTKKDILSTTLIPISIDFGDLGRYITVPWNQYIDYFSRSYLPHYAYGGRVTVSVEADVAKVNLNGVLNATPLAYMLGLVDRSLPSGVPPYFRLIR